MPFWGTGMNTEDTFHLVVEAVAHSEPINDYQYGFNKTAENKLTKTTKNQILHALGQLRDKEKVIALRLPWDQLREKNLHILGTIQKNRRTGEMEIKKQEPGDGSWIPKFEFVFTRKANFANWYQLWKLRQNLTLTNLTPVNCYKVINTILDIHEKLQMNPSEKISIPISFGNSMGFDVFPPEDLKRARSESLEFLKTKGVISSFKYHIIGFGADYIEIYLHLDSFMAIKEEAESILQELALLKKSGTAPTFSGSFPLPEDKSWSNVEINLVSENAIEVEIEGIKKIAISFVELGLQDRRRTGAGDMPGMLWSLLKLFAEHEGELNWKSNNEQRGSRSNLPKKIQMLGDKLCAFFKTKEKPFFPYDKKTGAYRTKFAIGSKIQSQISRMEETDDDLIKKEFTDLRPEIPSDNE